MRKINHLPFLLFLLAGLASPSSTSASSPEDWVLRDHPAALTLSKGRVEIGLEYQAINKTIDIFGVWEDEYETLSSIDRAAAPGDLWGGRLLLNYGLFPGTTLLSSFQYRNQDYGFDSIGIKTLDLSVRQRLYGGDNDRLPRLVLDAGVRFNSAGDTHYDDQVEINAIVQRVMPGSDVKIRIDSDYVWFDREVDGDRFSYGRRREGRPDPEVTVGDLQDLSPYARLTGGVILGRFFPNLFVEFGHTQIRSKVDTTLDDYVPEFYRDDIPQFPMDLSRSENFLKTGMNLMINLPYHVSLQLEYDYLRLFREAYLGYMDDNHIFKAELNYGLTAALVLTAGGTYFHRQLNGEIPFMYNEFTQTTFDHPYGYIHIGLTWILGGKN